MEEKSKKRKKGSIREEDVSTLLLRYSVKTVLTLLQEVSKVAGERIDWNEIVKNTATGISSAREYQTLWRHLAYGQFLTDEFGNAANPSDNDSDLECEMEASPSISWETSMEAAACVKVLIASDYPIDFHVPNSSTVEAPLTINIPKFKVPSDSSIPANAMQGTNITIPVSVEKEPLSSGTCEKKPKDGKSGVDLTSRRKRRVWSTEDDVKLTAAVQKHGEQNWDIIARDFMNDRKASELSTRWANIRKKKGNTNAGTSLELSEARVAASQAISLALGNHMKAARQMSNVGTKLQHESQNVASSPSDLQLGILGPPKSQMPAERPSMNTKTMSPNSMVRNAAVAAGARIATPAEAAAHSPNAFHSRTGVSSLMKSTTTSTPNQLSSNMHLSHNVLKKAPVSAYSAALPSLQLGKTQNAQGNSIKPAELAAQLNPIGSANVLDVSSGMMNASDSNPITEVAETAEVAVVSTSARETKKLAQREQGADLDNISAHATMELISAARSAPTGNRSKQNVNEHQTSASGNTVGGYTQGDQASNSFSDPINQTHDDRVALPCSVLEDNGKKHSDGVTASKQVRENTNSNVGHEDLLSTSVDGGGEESNTTAAAAVEEIL